MRLIAAGDPSWAAFCRGTGGAPSSLSTKPRRPFDEAHGERKNPLRIEGESARAELVEALGWGLQRLPGQPGRDQAAWRPPTRRRSTVVVGGRPALDRGPQAGSASCAAARPASMASAAQSKSEHADLANVGLDEKSGRCSRMRAAAMCDCMTTLARVNTTDMLCGPRSTAAAASSPSASSAELSQCGSAKERNTRVSQLASRGGRQADTSGAARTAEG